MDENNRDSFDSAMPENGGFNFSGDNYAHSDNSFDFSGNAGGKYEFQSSSFGEPGQQSPPDYFTGEPSAWSYTPAEPAPEQESELISFDEPEAQPEEKEPEPEPVKEKKKSYRRLQVGNIWVRTAGEILALVIAITVCCSMVVLNYEANYEAAASRTAAEDAAQLAHSISPLADSELMNISDPVRSEYVGSHYSELLDSCFLSEDLLYSGAIYSTVDNRLFACSGYYISTLTEHGLIDENGALSSELSQYLSTAAGGAESAAVFGNIYMSFVPCYDDSGLFAVTVSAVTYQDSMAYNSLVKSRIVQITIVCGILVIAYYLISAARSAALMKKAEAGGLRIDSEQGGKYSGGKKKAAKSEKTEAGSLKDKLFTPNVLKVSLRLIILAVLGFASYYIYFVACEKTPGVALLALIGLMLLVCAVILIQLIVWAIKWVANERVSELGLHIVRFAVILTAVSLTVFVMLSLDYTNQYTDSLKNGLRQQILAARVEMQADLGDELVINSSSITGIQDGLSELLDENRSNSDRNVRMYLLADSSSAAFNNTRFSSFGTSGTLVAASTMEGVYGISEEFILQVLDSDTLVFSEYTAGSDEYYAAFCPVFTGYGEPVGVIEINELKQVDSVFRFTTIELWLIVAAVVVLFSCAFYGFMQFFDITLRSKNFDKSRQLLSCGREAARPMLFFSSLTAALPLALLLFSDGMRGLIFNSSIPSELSVYIPVIAYIFAFCIGALAVKRHSKTLSELPSAFGLAFTFLANLCIMLFMHVDALKKYTEFNNWKSILALIIISGIGCGMSYRTTAKFQDQSDLAFGADKYAYLCTSFGAVAGVLAGAVLFTVGSELTLRIAIAVLSLFTMVLSIALLEDLKTTEEIGKSVKNELLSYGGALLGILPVILSYCLIAVRGSAFLYAENVNTVAICLCNVLPVIAFCFGNRLRVGKHAAPEKSKSAKKLALLAGGIFSALSVLPLILMSGENIILSCVIAYAGLCLGAIFTACGIYSIMKSMELRKTAGWVRLFALLGILASIAAVSFGGGTRELFISIGFMLVAVLAAVFSMLGKFPERPSSKRTAVEPVEMPQEDDMPKLASGEEEAPALPEAQPDEVEAISQDEKPAITDGETLTESPDEVFAYSEAEKAEEFTPDKNQSEPELSSEPELKPEPDSAPDTNTPAEEPLGVQEAEPTNEAALPVIEDDSFDLKPERKDDQW